MASNRQKKLEAIENRIVGVEEVSPHIKLLVYGRNGQGKTRLAASAPRVLIIDVNEHGTRSAREFTGAKVLTAAKWEDVVYAKWYLRENLDKYDSVAIDTITNLQQLCMTQVLKEGVERDPNRDPKLPVQRDWGKVTEMMKKELFDFRNLPLNVIFTAQERVIEDDEGMVEEITVDMSRGNRNIATGCVEIIGRIYQREVKRGNKKTGKEVSSWETRMLVGPHEEYITKDRTNALGRIMRNPSIPKILKAIETQAEEGN